MSLGALLFNVPIDVHLLEHRRYDVLAHQPKDFQALWTADLQWVIRSKNKSLQYALLG